MFIDFVKIILLPLSCDSHAIIEVSDFQTAFVAKCVNVSELPTNEI